MLIAVLLLLPVTIILLWAYWYILPRGFAAGSGPRFSAIDVAGMVVLLAGGLWFMRWALHNAFQDAGPIVPPVVAVAGGYTIFAFGLLGMLVLRRALSRS